jgi:hypothetical protein
MTPPAVTPYTMLLPKLAAMATAGGGDGDGGGGGGGGGDGAGAGDVDGDGTTAAAAAAAVMAAAVLDTAAATHYAPALLRLCATRCRRGAALVMAALFKQGDALEKMDSVWALTFEHARNLAAFAVSQHDI